MDTTVITQEVQDYGAGKTNRVVFVASAYSVDPTGALHVFRKDDGNVASFPSGAWQTVLRGTPYAAQDLTAVDR